MSLKYRAKYPIDRNNPVKEYDNCNSIFTLICFRVVLRNTTLNVRRGKKRIYDGNNFRSSQEFIRHRALLTTTIS